MTKTVRCRFVFPTGSDGDDSGDFDGIRLFMEYAGAVATLDIPVDATGSGHVYLPENEKVTCYFHYFTPEGKLSEKSGVLEVVAKPGLKERQVGNKPGVHSC